MRDVEIHDMQSVLYEELTSKYVREVKIFMSLAKYYYNTTYLFILKSHYKSIIFQILINHVNAINIIKLCQSKQHQLTVISFKNIRKGINSQQSTEPII